MKPAPIFFADDPLGLMVKTATSADTLYNDNIVAYAVLKSTEIINTLDADTKAIAIKLFREAFKVGLLPLFFSGRRSFDKQNELYKAWLKKEKGANIAAPPGESFHNYGRAFDVMILAQDGETPFEYGSVGLKLINEKQKLGLRWGGYFKPSDPYHFANDSIPISELKRTSTEWADFKEANPKIKSQSEQGEAILFENYRYQKGRIKRWFRKNITWLIPVVAALTLSIFGLALYRWNMRKSK